MVQYIHAVLRNALQNAVREEQLSRNVAKLVQVESPDYDVGQGLPIDEAQHLLSIVKETRWHSLYVGALLLGLRRGSCRASGGRMSISMPRPSACDRTLYARAASSTFRRRRRADLVERCLCPHPH
jgi:hypothetical protein